MLNPIEDVRYRNRKHQEHARRARRQPEKPFRVATGVLNRGSPGCGSSEEEEQVTARAPRHAGPLMFQAHLASARGSRSPEGSRDKQTSIEVSEKEIVMS